MENAPQVPLADGTPNPAPESSESRIGWKISGKSSAMLRGAHRFMRESLPYAAMLAVGFGALGVLLSGIAKVWLAVANHLKDNLPTPAKDDSTPSED